MKTSKHWTTTKNKICPDGERWRELTYSRQSLGLSSMITKTTTNATSACSGETLNSWHDYRHHRSEARGRTTRARHGERERGREGERTHTHSHTSFRVWSFQHQTLNLILWNTYVRDLTSVRIFSSRIGELWIPS
jgi:hypothetical protein